MSYTDQAIRELGYNVATMNGDDRRLIQWIAAVRQQSVEASGKRMCDKCGRVGSLAMDIHEPMCAEVLPQIS